MTTAMKKQIQPELNPTLICTDVTGSFKGKWGSEEGKEQRLALETGAYQEEKQTSCTSMIGGSSVS